MPDARPDAAMLPPFAGFRPDALAFFTDLAANQDRAWFQANRDRYEAGVRDPLASLVVALTEELRRRRIPLHGHPVRSLFRIHRDVRFSRSKEPYKTHAGATLTRDGAKLSPGVLYLHLDPAGSFVATGFYRPEPPALDAIRRALVARAAAWRRALADLARAGLVLEPDEDALKRAPRGFESAPDDLSEALRRRSFVIRRPLATEETADASLVPRVADFVAAAMPLLRFGWKAIDEPAG